MFETIHLDSYLDRIGYTGSRDPELSVLSEIAFAHATSIPFENLDVLAGMPISLAMDQIVDKLVTRRRGGYCFEQNSLLGAALAELGFDVHYLSARVWYNPSDDQIPPRTHVFLRVDVNDEPWLVDCGIGGSAPTGPMRLDRIGVEQRLPFESRRIIRIDNALVPTFMHQINFSGVWNDVCEFTGESMPMIDQAMGNWWTSTHPDSKFRRRLIVAMINRDGTRMSLVDREFTHRRNADIIERFPIQSIDHLHQTLASKFQLACDYTLDEFPGE